MIAFKSTPAISNEDDEEEDNKDLSLVVKNLRRMYNKAKFNNRRCWQGKEDKKIIYFNCRKPGHMVAECEENKSKHQPPRSPTKRRLWKLHEIRKVNPKKRWTRHMCVSCLMTTHPR